MTQCEGPSTDSTTKISTVEGAWTAAGVPSFDCPDPVIRQTYDFRWQVFRKHLRQTPAGWVITEFSSNVPWAGTHGTISCSAGHHFYEGRWIDPSIYLDDYSRFWFGPEAAPRRYSFWVADALYARYLVSGDARLPIALLDDLVRNYAAWEAERREPSGLFWQIDDRDGMEFQISGSGCRPTINSYMFADARAIGRIAELAGRGDVAAQFRAEAAGLKSLVQEQLWDAGAGFFKTLVTETGQAQDREKYGDDALGLKQIAGRLADVRELQGYVPWVFHLPDSGYEHAWQHLMDPQGFYGLYGPCTAERRHPAWKPAPTATDHDCLWRGSSWPFATSHTLMGMANLLHDYEQAVVSKADYLSQLRTYARSQRRTLPNGEVVPWIDESLHPDTGTWVTRDTLYERASPNKDRGADYNHSTFCDLVITGLVGLKPRADDVLEVDPLLPDGAWDYFRLDKVRYHGELLTVLYDALGTHYGEEAGLQLFVNGRRVASAPRLQKLCVPLQAIASSSTLPLWTAPLSNTAEQSRT